MLPVLLPPSSSPARDVDGLGMPLGMLADSWSWMESPSQDPQPCSILGWPLPGPAVSVCPPPLISLYPPSLLPQPGKGGEVAVSSVPGGGHERASRSAHCGLSAPSHLSDWAECFCTHTLLFYCEPRVGFRNSRPLPASLSAFCRPSGCILAPSFHCLTSSPRGNRDSCD